MSNFYQFALCILALVSFSYLARTMLGPTFFDRILGANNISTIVTVMICILAVEQGEQYLVDVALIYSMLGFVTVVIVCKAYLRSHNMELYSRFRNLPAPVKVERLTTEVTVLSHHKESCLPENIPETKPETQSENISENKGQDEIQQEDSSPKELESKTKSQEEKKKVSPVQNPQKKNYPNQKSGKSKKKGGKKS